MANTQINFSDYVKYYLVSDSREPLEVKNMVGWDEFGLDCRRNLEYHGTLTQVTKTFSFVGEAKDYLLEEEKRKGVTARVALIRLSLDSEPEISFDSEDIVYADFNTISEKDNTVSLKFNTNSLQDLIDSYEDIEFEIERLESVTNQPIEKFKKFIFELKGREISGVGESKVLTKEILTYAPPSDWHIDEFRTFQTEFISQGPARHSTVNSSKFRIEGNNPTYSEVTAANLFYVNATAQEDEVTLKVEINYDFIYRNQENISRLTVIKFVYNPTLASYQFVEEFIISNYNAGVDIQEVNTFKFQTNLFWNEGLCFCLVHKSNISVVEMKANIKINESIFQEPFTKISFSFMHDVLERLMYIISSRKNSFYSSYFGRKEKGYKEDGEMALIGFISGLWARAFSEDSDKYKSPKISLEDAVKSVNNCFGLGAGIETVNNIERLVVEDLEYFYRKEIVGRFPVKIQHEEVETDASMNYSKLIFGYEKGGNYEEQMGLDEPNVKSEFITPIKNSSNRFEKLVKIRADETGLQKQAVKPQINFPNDNLNGDEDNWFLDLKRSQENGVDYEQVSWQDRLVSEPKGIFSPETFKTMIFTPLQILKRHAKNFKSGIYMLKNEFINFTSNSANRNLEMQFLNEIKSFKESQNLLIDDLERAIFKNKIIKFSHPYSEEVRKMIFGKTKVKINGEERYIPNFFFKYEIENVEGKIYTGYFLSYEYSDFPVFKFLLSNEEI